MHSAVDSTEVNYDVLFRNAVILPLSTSNFSTDVLTVRDRYQF